MSEVGEVTCTCGARCSREVGSSWGAPVAGVAGVGNGNGSGGGGDGNVRLGVYQIIIVVSGIVVAIVDAVSIIAGIIIIVVAGTIFIEVGIGIVVDSGRRKSVR